jgi:hypothetical protein
MDERKALSPTKVSVITSSSMLNELSKSAEPSAALNCRTGDLQDDLVTLALDKNFDECSISRKFF